MLYQNLRYIICDVNKMLHFMLQFHLTLFQSVANYWLILYPLFYSSFVHDKVVKTSFQYHVSQGYCYLTYLKQKQLQSNFFLFYKKTPSFSIWVISLSWKYFWVYYFSLGRFDGVGGVQRAICCLYSAKLLLKLLEFNSSGAPLGWGGGGSCVMGVFKGHWAQGPKLMPTAGT